MSEFVIVLLICALVLIVIFYPRESEELKRMKERTAQMRRDLQEMKDAR